jgi:hypothetical protein
MISVSTFAFYFNLHRYTEALVRYLGGKVVVTGATARGAQYVMRSSLPHLAAAAVPLPSPTAALASASPSPRLVTPAHSAPLRL